MFYNAIKNKNWVVIFNIKIKYIKFDTEILSHGHFCPKDIIIQIYKKFRSYEVNSFAFEYLIRFFEVFNL